MVMSDIQIINFGLDSQFRNTERLLKSLVNAFSDSQQEAKGRRLDVCFTRTFRKNQFAQRLRERTFVTHVMAHGTPDGSLHGLYGLLNSQLSAEQTLRQPAAKLGMDVLVLDACQTFSKAWRAQVREALPRGRSLTLIGTTRDVGWNEATMYMATFYGTLLSHPVPRGRDARIEMVTVAHRRAKKLMNATFVGGCSFALVEIKK